jgi:hypothetical protein
MKLEPMNLIWLESASTWSISTKQWTILLATATTTPWIVRGIGIKFKSPRVVPYAPAVNNVSLRADHTGSV